MTAYDAYLQGRHQFNSFEPGSLRDALQSFRAATDADPDFAAAWAARATTVIAMREDAFREGIPREESVLLASNAIERALAIDPELAEAHVAQAMLLADSYQFEEALESLNKALAINPSLVDALRLNARILSRFGRIGEAQQEILKALRLDPHNQITAILAANLADEYYDPEFFATVERSTMQFDRPRQIIEERRLRNDKDAALAALRKFADSGEEAGRLITILQFQVLGEVNKQATEKLGRTPGMFLMWLYAGSDQWQEAEAIYNNWPERIQELPINLEEISIMYASQGKCELALETLSKAHGSEVKIYGEISPNAGRSNSNLALNRVHCLRQLQRPDEADEILARVRNYVGTLRQNTVYGFYMIDAKLQVLDGDIEGALDILEAAEERGEVAWTDRYDPVLRTLARDPRFQSLFKRIDDRIDAMRAELGLPPALR